MLNIVVGLFFLVVTLGLVYKKWRALSQALRAPGVIVEVEEKFEQDHDGTMHWISLPVVEFNHAGRRFRFVNEVGGTQYANHEAVIGAEVQVVFNLDHPEQAKIVGVFSLWLIEIITTILGISFFLSGVYLVLR